MDVQHLLLPGERVLLELTGPKLAALEERGTDVRGEHESEKRYHLLAEGPNLLVTDLRLLVLNHRGQLDFEAIRDLPCLHTVLGRLRKWNDVAEGRKARAEESEGRATRKLMEHRDERKFGIVDSVNALAWAERPSGVLGPHEYVLLTVCHFRPVSAERQAVLETEKDHASGLLGRAALELQIREIGAVFSFEPVQLSIHEKDKLDTLVGLLSSKTAPMTDYLSGPQGMEADYGLPTGSTRSLAGYRPGNAASAGSHLARGR